MFERGWGGKGHRGHSREGVDTLRSPQLWKREASHTELSSLYVVLQLYTKVMGLAYSEKAADPSWRIANGVVDRCYYQGSKRTSLLFTLSIIHPPPLYQQGSIFIVG